MILRVPVAETESRLEALSDRISPIVVKEVRQMVRGREFNYSFALSIIAGLIAAFVAGTGATAGTGEAGVRIFSSLTFCLALIGLVISPLGAFSALRNERMERTLDLVTVTTLPPRRIVIGKLMAQAVKLATLFAALAPFVATSFLLGGIGFPTIVLTLSGLFMWSLWACAAALFLSCLSKSRAISALILGVMIVFLLIVFVSSGIGFLMTRTVLGGPRVPGSPFSSLFASGGSDVWWAAAAMTLVWGVTLINLVLLSENRLLLPTEDRSTALRIGFFVQFLLIIGFAVSNYFTRTVSPFSNPEGEFINILAVLCGIHLAVVATFSVTEELVLSRRIAQQIQAASGWRRYLEIFRPGAVRGAAYVMAQMLLLLVVAAMVVPISGNDFGLLLAICGYICFFTGVPACIGRMIRSRRFQPLHLRLGIALLLLVAILLPDFLVYLATGDFGGIYSLRHVLDPFRTLGSWRDLTTAPWHSLSALLGLIGVAAYLKLIQMGRTGSITRVDR